MYRQQIWEIFNEFSNRNEVEDLYEPYEEEEEA
jgi:hypothetical protein